MKQRAPAPSALARAERDTLAAISSAPSGDETVAERAQGLLLALVRAGEYRRALDFGRESARRLGWDRLAASEILPLIALGNRTEARAVAESLADTPVETGGHGLRAIVRTLLGRDDDAATDGAEFVADASAMRASVAAWRAVSRRYGTSSALVHARYADLHAELERAFGSTRWSGEPVDGRTVVLQLVEGLGDNLQALRFAATLRARGARILVGCDPRIQSLIADCDLADAFIDRPIPERHAYGRADYHLVVGGWLHESGLPASMWWHEQPYLALTPADAPRVMEDANAPRVGIVWAGNPDFALEATRGMPYGALKRLVGATPDVSWISLQRFDHPRAAELRATPVTRRVIDAGDALQSMLDTARLVASLDLVVATDSAVAHLAGALGVPVWLVLGPTYNWRWRLDGESVPLYPSMRIIRDATGGDWNAAVDRVARELALNSLPAQPRERTLPT